MAEESKSKKKCSWVGRFFQWIDDNILSKTTRLLMYVLEFAGIFAIYMILHEFIQGIDMMTGAANEFELQKAQLIVDSVKEFASPLAVMVTTICGAIPTIMGVFKSLKKKWGVDDTSMELKQQVIKSNLQSSSKKETSDISDIPHQ